MSQEQPELQPETAPEPAVPNAPPITPVSPRKRSRLFLILLGSLVGICGLCVAVFLLTSKQPLGPKLIMPIAERLALGTPVPTPIVTPPIPTSSAPPDAQI